MFIFVFFFSSRRRHTRLTCDWSSDVCSSDLRSTLIVAYVREGKHAADGAAMLDRARERVLAAELKIETAAIEGDADIELATLAKTADAVLVGRRGVTTAGSALGPTVVSLIRIAERCVIVCGGVPS